MPSYNGGTPPLQSSYLSRSLINSERKVIIKRTLRVLRKVMKKTPFQAIAFRGMSGATIAPIIADKLNVDLIIIRKGESNHSSFDLEGPLGVSFIIIDDFIDSGHTLESIIESTLQNRFLITDCIGIYLYNSMTERETLTKYNVRCLNNT